MPQQRNFKLVVIGASSGGMQAITTLLSGLPADFSLPIAIVQHISPTSDSMLPEILGRRVPLRVKEAEEKETLQPATVYLAPPNYHLLVEQDLTLTLTVDEPVSYARPSIDVLFETAAEACGPQLVGIVMTGANSDGANGLQQIKNQGGLTVVQSPESAESRQMPLSAISRVRSAYVLNIGDIQALLLAIDKKQRSAPIL